MKYLFPILIFMLLYNGANAQNFETTKDRTGRKMLKGFVTDSLLKADTSSFKWFIENEQVYKPSDAVVRSFNSKKDSVSYMVFFGTWCPDSHYVIPRFYKIANQAGTEKSRITLFALDRTKNDAAHFAANFNVKHVPTIIILKNGKEIGRVVEYGTSGRFDEELTSILDKSN
ncbi:thioredoxin family protein [Niabella ginsengisoli]|uniref:Thioredoxin family protein n=1 Tax=Niabella ginsengisoli TaxID=522298 RepID=A0ABS9SND0_9BACT|nr:thioredoxin family protein [Niabella ginsengisoli]MCH5599893.1 thioredoxin family protein [Niabella ginsengisoli]